MFQIRPIQFWPPHFARAFKVLTYGTILCFGGCLSQAADDSTTKQPTINAEKPSAKVVAQIQKDAQAGNAKARFVLGMLHARGDGVSFDLKEAVTWFRRAADLDHASAQGILGLMTAMGYGMKQDDRAAVQWFRRAQANGFDLQAMRLEYCQKHEELRTAESRAILEHIQKYQELNRGLWPEAETYQDLDGSFRFYEGSVNSRHERDSDALFRQLKASRPARERDMDSYEKLVQLIDEAISASSDQK